MGEQVDRNSGGMGVDFEALGGGIGVGLVRGWLGIAEGLVSILRDWSTLGEVFVWVF